MVKKHFLSFFKKIWVKGFPFAERKPRSGFTLNELLIVISIVGVLSTASFVAYKSQIGKGWDKKRKDHLSRLKVTFEDYYNDNNCYPLSDTLSPCGEGADQLNPYLRIVPCDPKTNQPYTLVTENDTCPQWYKIYTTLDFKEDQNIKNLGCDAGCGSSKGDYVNGIETSEDDYTYNYGVSSSNEEVGYSDQYYCGYDKDGKCNILSNDGIPPDCEPYFAGTQCGEPVKECK